MQYPKRPVLEIPKTPLEQILNVVSFLFLVGNVIYIIMEWSSLPNRIPIHFNGVGEVDGWGGKSAILLLPIISLNVWIGLTILEKYPHTYNYFNLNEKNIECQYKNARMIANVVKSEIVCFFAYTSWKTIQIAAGHEAGTGILDLLIFLIILFWSIAFFITRSFRLK